MRGWEECVNVTPYGGELSHTFPAGLHHWSGQPLEVLFGDIELLKHLGLDTAAIA